MAHKALSIGIIMDGNRRYSKQHNISTLEGHRAGYRKLQEVLRWARETNIKAVTVYAFSTENWNRTEKEVSYLMNLFRFAIVDAVSDARKNKTRLIFLGDRTRLPEDICIAMERAEKDTRAGVFIVGIALSYGGRSEIIDALQRLPKEKSAAIKENEFGRYLWSKDIPDPDIIIRTSGEKRLSGFLLWQSAYSELFFTDTLWPDFTREEFDRILEEYGKRKRRFGK